MFRIKTDIRHYRCNSRDKVERLIRNWVIRPSDLVYDTDAEDWHPIGDHPTFVDLFTSLDQQHDNQPATVVTDRAANKADKDRSDAEKTPTNGAKSAPGSAVLRPLRSAKDNAAGEDQKQPEPPEPSDDVEGIHRDSDEITTMTERTLDLITAEKPTDLAEDSSPAPPVAEDDVESLAAPDEDTELIERATAEKSAAVEDAEDTADQRSEESEAEELRPDLIPGRRLGRHSLPEEAFATAELKDERKKRKASVEDEVEERERLDELSRLDGLDEDKDKVPERNLDESSDKIIDDDSDQNAQSDWRRETPSRWNIVLTDFPPDDEESPSAEPQESAPQELESGHELDDALCDTADFEFDKRDLESEDTVDQIRDTAELELDDIEVVDEHEKDDDEDLRETVDLGPPVSREDDDEDLIVAEPVPADFEVDEEALDEAFEDLEESAIAARQGSDESSGDPEDLEELAVIEPIGVDSASSITGYEVEFPVPIEPTAEAFKLGIERTNASTRKKNRLFALPEPKTPEEIVFQTYELTNRSSFPLSKQWLLVIGGIVAFFVLMTVTAIAGYFAIIR